MANFYVTNSLYPDNPQLFTITIKQVVKRAGEPNTVFNRDNRGELYWEACIATTGITATGAPIPWQWVDVKGSEITVHELISNKINEMCSEIDWSQQGTFSIQQDRRSPVVTSQFPTPSQTGVALGSTIEIVLEDFLPSKGIDINTLSLKVKGIEVSPTVVGNPFKYTISYTPKVV